MATHEPIAHTYARNHKALSFLIFPLEILKQLQNNKKQDDQKQETDKKHLRSADIYKNNTHVFGVLFCYETSSAYLASTRERNGGNTGHELKQTGNVNIAKLATGGIRL